MRAPRGTAASTVEDNMKRAEIQPVKQMSLVAETKHKLKQSSRHTLRMAITDK